MKTVMAFRYDGGDVQGFVRKRAGRKRDGSPRYYLEVPGSKTGCLDGYAHEGDWVVELGSGEREVLQDREFREKYDVPQCAIAKGQAIEIRRGDRRLRTSE